MRGRGLRETPGGKNEYGYCQVRKKGAERRETENQSQRLMLSWRRTLIKNIGGLMELSTQGVLKALREGDPTICLLVFKLLYQRSHAWRKRLVFASDPTTAREQLEQAFAEGQLSTDEYGVLIRGRELQLKIAEAEALKDKLASMEDKLNALLTHQQGGGSDGTTTLPTRYDGEATREGDA